MGVKPGPRGEPTRSSHPAQGVPPSQTLPQGAFGPERYFLFGIADTASSLLTVGHQNFSINSTISRVPS
jgi:hypothetical protein